MRRTAALPLLAATALAAAAPAAAQEVWTGAAGSKSWNDGGNWASGRAPAPTIGLFALFDDPAGAAFGFGGSAPLRFGRIELSTNSGPVTLKAPGFVLGGSVNGEPDIGFIAEDVATDAVLRNYSTGALTLRGGAAAGWNLVVDATNGPIRIEGGLDPAGHSVAQRGPHPLEIAGGEPVDFRSFDFAEGGLTLAGRADVAIPNLELGATRFADRIGAPEVRVEGGSTLRITNSVNNSIWFRYPFVLGTPGKTDKSTFVGNQGRLSFNRAPSFSAGSCITNVGPVCFGFHPTSDIPRTVRVPSGMRIHAQGIWLGGTPNIDWNRFDRLGHNGIKLLVEGPEIPDTPGPKKLSGPPTLLDLDQRGFLVGGSFDSGNSSNALARLSGAVVLRTTGWIMVPELPRRNDGNRLFLEGGARADAKGVEIGGASSTNVLSLSGEGTSLMVGGEGVYLGYGSEQPGESVGNRIVIKDRARLHSEGPVRIGRGRRHNDRNGSLSKDNTLTVSGGARLVTAGAEIGVATFTGPVLSPAVVIDGTGSRWDLSAQGVVVGNARGAALSNAVLSIRNGAAVTNARDVVVGSAAGSTARDCRLRLTAARLFTHGNVYVGRTSDGGGDYESVGNSVVLAGANTVGALWDFGGGGLYVGLSEGWRHTVRDNFLELRPGARVQNVGRLILGCGTHSEAAFSEGNELRLLGGSIAPVKSLRMGKGGILALGINPASKLGTTPVEVEGDVDIEKGAFVKPLPGKGVRPRLFPVLRWKGNAKGLENLALAPGVDAAKWKLHVDAEKKQVLLQMLP
jgi:hypothetical protein